MLIKMAAIYCNTSIGKRKYRADFIMFRYSVIPDGATADDSTPQQQQHRRDAEKPPTATITPPVVVPKQDESMKNATTNQTKPRELVESSSPTTSHDERFLLSRGYFLMNRGLLGEGTYSKVKRAYSKFRGHDVAIKIVNRKIAPKDFLKRFLPRELEIIGQVKHANICKFYEVLDIGDKVFIMMEYAPRGDLLEYIQKHRFLREDMARSLFLQVRC